MSAKPIVYLSGPIAGCSDEEIYGWRNAWRERWGSKYCRDPSRRVWESPGDNWKNHEQIIETDLEDIDFSDVCLTYYKKPSAGTCMENVHAYMGLKLVIIVVADEETYNNISPWMIYHARHVVKTFDEAEAIIRKEFHYYD